MRGITLSLALAAMVAISLAPKALFATSLVSASGHALFNGVNDRPFLVMMGSVEGPDGYDTVTRATRLQPAKPLTQMTIREVLDFQRQVRASGASSSAMGRYQFIRQTLAYMVETHGIDDTLLFDQITQDSLARIEMRRCQFYEPVVVDWRVANCLAQVWAALPVVNGRNAGRSHYHGTAGNRALVTREAFLGSLRARFADSRMAGW